MNSNIQPSARRCWLLLAILLAHATGCFAPGQAVTNPASRIEDAASQPPDEKPAGPNPLADDQWVFSVAAKGSAEQPACRWRNLSLEQFSVLPVERQSQLKASLSPGGVPAANAAIMAAREKDPRAAAALLRAIEDPMLKLPLRRAAAEALAFLPQETAARNLHAALAGIERKVGNMQPAYNADLHAELLIALARHRSADDDSAFTQALDKEGPQIRLAALERWAAPGKTPLPPKALELCQDFDPRIRAAALKALVARRCDETEEQLQRATRDPNLDVRLAAIAGLGTLGTPTARTTLDQLLAREGEIVRAACVSALVEMGATEVVTTATKDKSWHVRMASAQNLAHVPPDANGGTARALVTDPTSGDVQRAAIAAVAAWPLPAAGPLWLTAMESGGNPARKAASRQLAEHWPPAKEYSADAPPERRAARLAELRAKWRKEFGEIASDTVPPLSPDNEPSDRPLPDHNLAKTLERLRSADLDERRRGAKDLAQAATREPLAADLLAQIVPLIAAEQDPTIWQTVLTALADNPRPAATDLACAGLSHPAADVRRRACEHLASHGRPENAAALVASLSDEQVAVQIAAAKALGRIGSVQQTPALERLLLVNEKTVRVAAAESLLRLGAPQGAAALERLTYDSDEKVRRQAVEAMGQSGREEFIPSLVRMLDDRASVKQAAIAALERIAGAEVIQSADAATTVENTDDVARRWKKWYASKSEVARRNSGG